MNACQELKSRIDPVRDEMPAGSAWSDVIEMCYDNGVDLSARAWCVRDYEIFLNTVHPGFAFALSALLSC